MSIQNLHGAWELGYAHGYDDREKMDHDRADVLKTQNPYLAPDPDSRPVLELRARNDVVRAAMAFDEGGDFGVLTAACARLRLIEQHEANAGWVPRLGQFVRSRYTGHRYCIEELAPGDPDGRTVKLNNGSWLSPAELIPEKENANADP